MSVIERFLDRYTKELDFYQEAARLCAQQCEAGLERSGIRAIVTFRAKRPERLKEKLENRNSKKKYRNVDEIYKDIIDLSGVRIAIYFPGDREEIHKFIDSNFIIKKKKTFPEPSKKVPYETRFQGYFAVHYLVQLRDDILENSRKRYTQALIEIQVASVLMHAWAEVEHDMVYKPLSGNLSEEEYAILDELNGLVHTGEIALEMLQKAYKTRVAEKGKSFSNHYELSAFIYDSIKRKGTKEPIMGRADVLYRFLQVADLNKPECIEKYLGKVDPDSNNIPTVNQIVDAILADNPQLYEIYDKAKLDLKSYQTFSKISSISHEQTMVSFIKTWADLEKTVRKISGKPYCPKYNLSISKMLNKIDIDKNVIFELDTIRKLRNKGAD